MPAEPHAPSLPARCGMALVKVYQWTLSPLLHTFFPGQGCRYEPTCSHYAWQSLRRFGLLRGGWLAARRLLSCHPWGGEGHDPVPETWPGWLTSRRRWLRKGRSDSSPCHFHG